MAKVIIPSHAKHDIEVQGIGELHPVDQQMVGEILAELEAQLREEPCIRSLQEVATRFMADESHHASATMLLTLAKDAGEPILTSNTVSTRNTLH